MRIFVAIDISSQAKKEIEKLLKVLKRKHWKVKWEKPDKLHLTLAFLGWRKPEKLALITKICQKSATNMEPFMISFKGLGCFPDYDQPRVVWLGLKGDLQTLAKLHKQLNQNLKESGFKIDSRPFSPHITLGRLKKARAKERREIGRQLKSLRIMNSPASPRRSRGRVESGTRVDRVVIYESKLSRLGAEYKRLKEVKL